MKRVTNSVGYGYEEGYFGNEFTGVISGEFNRVGTDGFLDLEEEVWIF